MCETMQKDSGDADKLPGGGSLGSGLGIGAAFTEGTTSDTMEEKGESNPSQSSTSASWKTKLGDLYLKYKGVFDDAQYYDQETGRPKWPENDGFDGGGGHKEVIKKDTIFKRYGGPGGCFLGNATDSFEQRSLQPISIRAEVHYYRLTVDYNMITGRVAPWFGFEGGGVQFFVLDENGNNKYTIQDLIDLGILEEII